MRFIRFMPDLIVNIPRAVPVMKTINPRKFEIAKMNIIKTDSMMMDRIL